MRRARPQGHSQISFSKTDPANPDSLGNICANPDDARWQYEIIYSPFSDPIPARVYGRNVPRPVLPPKSVEAVALVYPYQLLKANITGSAAVNMPCDAGVPDDAEIVAASRDEFCLALGAAMSFYKVIPQAPGGKPAGSMLHVTFDFNPADPELRVTEKTRQLLDDETNNPGKIIPEGKLDKPLKIREDATCNAMTYELRLRSTATAEFLVDETGHVHLPRIILNSAVEKRSTDILVRVRWLRKLHHGLESPCSSQLRNLG